MKACDSTCKTCSSSTNTSCVTCTSPSFLYSNSCLTECPAETFPDTSNQICQGIIFFKI